MKNIALFSGMLCAVASVASAGVGPFSEWNLVVRNDLNMSTSEVDGSALIGGSLLGGTSNYGVQGITASSGDGLAVGGMLAAGVTVNINGGGNFRITDPGNQLGTVNLNGGGSTITDPTVTAQASSVLMQAENASAFLSGLSANGSVDGGGNMNATPTLMDGQLVAVYEITQAQFNSLGQLNLNFGSAESVIINFIDDGSGAVDLIAPPNIIGGFNQANSSNILWNFGDATSIVVNNSFNGAILAPDAALSVVGGGINGSVIVDSIAVQNAEIRRNTYTGFVPTPGASALLGLGGLCVIRRRRVA